MKGIAHTLLLSLVLLPATLIRAAAPAADRIPVETFFAEADIRGVQLSPDGRYVAFMTTLGWGKVGIALLDLSLPGKGPEALVAAEDENIKTFFWKGGDILYGADIGGDESYTWHAIAAAPPKGGGKRQVRLLVASAHHSGRDYAELFDQLRYDPDHILIQGVREMNSGTVAIFKLNVRTGRRDPVASYDPAPDGVAVSDTADNNGVLRARAMYFADRLVYEVRPTPDSRYVRIAEFPPNKGDAPWDFLFFAADNETLYVLSTEHSDTNTLHTYNVRTGQWSEPLCHVEGGDIISLLTSHDRAKLYGVAYETERVHYLFFDTGRARLQKTIEQSLPPGTENTVVSSSDDEQIFVIRSHSDRDPGSYFVLDLKQGRITPIGRSMRGIDPKAMRPMEPVSFPARDGLVIHGYLTRPAGAEKSPAPLIIHPHGGPFGIRDDWGFDPEVQFLANRGYSVLQVNYRGSGGYGVKFQQAGYHEWGGKMQDDLTDAVKWAVAQGVTTADRVAIYGASYGGYATLAGLAFTPELYRCGINYVGVSDLSRQVANFKISFAPYNQLFGSQKLGDDSAYLHDRSPANFVQNIRVPLFNAYGENDPRVDIRQWKVLKSRLDEYKKTYEFMRLDDEGHGFRNEENRIGFYRRIESFLAKHLPVK